MWAVSWCEATDFFCKFFENSKQTFGYFCNVNRSFNSTQFANCLNLTKNGLSSLNHNNTFVTQLKFNGCQPHFIEEMCKSVQNLNTLDISHSRYGSLNFSAWNVGQLKKLNASHNQLTEIPKRLFREAFKLSEIDFSYNKIRRIDANAFENATKLVTISLSHNNISLVDESAFRNLTNLESIDISGNGIQTLEMMSNNRKLKSIFASNNPLLSIDCHTFTKMGAVSVFLTWKNVSELNTNCKSNQFHVILNDTVDGILQKSRGRATIHCKSGSMTNITSFTAGPNKIDNISNLMQCFGAKIKQMQLSGNPIGRLNATTFKRFIKLERLDLKDTMLSHFDFAALGNQKRLIELDISGNFLNELNRTSFERFKSLSTLKLSNTKLSFGDFNPFEMNNNLMILDVSFNNLTTVKFRILSPTLRNLSRFYAMDCGLTNASALVQYFSDSLLELDLSRNDFGSINVDTFKALQKLEYLLLNNANISTFQSNALQNNRRLKTLELADNKLHSIDFEMLPRSLMRLDLEGNNLSELIHWNGSKLRYLGVTGNLLSCEFVRQMQQQSEIRLVGDLLKQKNVEDCHRNVQSAIDLNVDTIAMALAIGIAIILFIVVVILYHSYRKKKNVSWDVKALQRIRKSMLDSDMFGPNVEMPLDQYSNDDQMEEISLSNNDYDHLRFDTDPMPVIDDDQHYQNFSLLNSNFTRSLTSRI